VIVCDDGSTEDIGAVSGRAGADHIRNDAGGWGAAGARNAGLARVRTPLVWFLDSDDLLLPDAIERLAAVMDTEPSPSFAFGRALIAERTATGWSPLDLIEVREREFGRLPDSIYVRNSVPTSATVVRTAAARAVGGFDENAEFSQDHRLWIDLARTAPPAHIPQLVAVYRKHVGSRHGPLLALDDNLRIADATSEVPELKQRRAARNGVLLVEAVGDARSSHRIREIPRLLGQLLLFRHGRLEALRSARRHYCDRRRGPARALAEWQGRPALRRWLASFR
jgi:glycosyltransferase involved in cell wall biosynthesis